VNITGASDLVHAFPGATNGQWVFSVMQYIPSTSTGTNYAILLNTYRPPYGTNDLNWSVQIQNNMDTGQIISDFGGGATLPMVMDQWVEERCEINLASNSVSEFYNGQLLSTHAWQGGLGGPGLNEIQALDLFANNAGPVYYDNVSLDLFQSYTIPINAGLNLIANQLDHGSNTLNEVFANVPDGCVLSKYNNPSGTWSNSYFSAGSWMSGTLTLSPGEGAYLQSPTNFTLTVTGTPHVPVLPVSISPGHLYLLSCQTNDIGTWDNIVGTDPENATLAYTYNGGFTAYQYSSDDGAWLPSAPSVPVGSALWIRTPGGGGSLYPPPVITQQPQNQFVPMGSNATFTVAATGTPPLRYQWRLNGAAILDATNAFLTVLYSGSTNIEVYDVVVSNDFGSIDSDPARGGPSGGVLFYPNPTQEYVCPGDVLVSTPDGQVWGNTVDPYNFYNYPLPIRLYLEQISGPFTLGNLSIQLDHGTLHSANGAGYIWADVADTGGSGFTYIFNVWADIPVLRNDGITPVAPGDMAQIKLHMEDGAGVLYPASSETFNFIVNYNLSVTPVQASGCCWNFTVTPRCGQAPPTDIVKIIAQIVSSSGAKIQSASSLGTIPADVNATSTSVTWNNLGTALTFPQTPNICFGCGNTAGIQVRFTGYNSLNQVVAELDETVTVSAPACQDTTPPTITGCPGPITDCSGVIPNVTHLFTALTVSDNCSSFAQLVITQTPMANSPANYGPNSITVTVKDQAGNPSSCLVVFNATPPPGILTIEQIPGSGWGGIDVKLTWTGGGFVEFTDDPNSGFWFPLLDRLTGIAPTSPYTMPADRPGGCVAFRLHCP
jgi:hypothetical protein